MGGKIGGLLGGGGTNAASSSMQGMAQQGTAQANAERAQQGMQDAGQMKQENAENRAVDKFQEALMKEANQSKKFHDMMMQLISNMK